MPRKRKRPAETNYAELNLNAGYMTVRNHPMFEPLLMRVSVVHDERSRCPSHGWAVVTANGAIHLHPTRLAAPEEWAYVIAHCLLHLGFGHFVERDRPAEWNAACCAYVAKFLATLRLGRRPEDMSLPQDGVTTEERLYERFCERGTPADFARAGTGGPAGRDLVLEEVQPDWQGRKPDWRAVFGAGLAAAVSCAVDVAAGVETSISSRRKPLTAAERARRWFVSSYPLLGSLAATFEIVEDPLVCARLRISVAAVDAESNEIFVNPAAALSEEECRFVLAHELLHVGLRHSARRQGRDPELWNVACDYVINGWLVEMGVGDMPTFGLLYDPELKGESADAIYDRIVTDVRRYRKLATLRGVGLGDILERGEAEWWTVGPGMDLDEFYRRCLSQGLAYHEGGGRGFLPAGLVEEIRALDVPPIPWDVELAKWFDEHFPPIERRRSYARQSRRQSSTPDIPRPRWVPDPRELDGRTFGVVLDTSGSMNRTLLAKALGAIASYSVARDVPAVRVVFCDALPYDQGYMAPEEVAGRVRVRGRGGTILQPGIDMLEAAEDFPPNGPLLVITDAYCDRVRVRRDHAFLVPHGAQLPFVAKGPVFKVR